MTKNKNKFPVCIFVYLFASVFCSSQLFGLSNSALSNIILSKFKDQSTLTDVEANELERGIYEKNINPQLRIQAQILLLDYSVRKDNDDKVINTSMLDSLLDSNNRFTVSQAADKLSNINADGLVSEKKQTS